MHDPFEGAGLVRLRDVIRPHGPVPVSKSSWWAGIKLGKYPRPVRVSKRIVAWRRSDIIHLLESFQ